MATSLVECSLAQLFKRADPLTGQYRGGPARAILHGLGENYRWLAVIYAICLIAAFALGFNAFQGNTVAGAAEASLGIDRMWSAIFLAVMTGFIVFGGIRRIAKASEVVVPVMAVGYLLMALVVILTNLGEIPSVISSIVANAFGFEEAVSGGMGAALAQACAAVCSQTRRVWDRRRTLQRQQRSIIRSAKASRRHSQSLSIPSSSAAVRPL